jgi:hypothetical protein
VTLANFTLAGAASSAGDDGVVQVSGNNAVDVRDSSFERDAVHFKGGGNASTVALTRVRFGAAASLVVR